MVGLSGQFILILTCMLRCRYLLAVNILFMKCPFKYFAHFSFRSFASLTDSSILTEILFDTCKADVKSSCGVPFPFILVSLDEHVIDFNKVLFFRLFPL